MARPLLVVLAALAVSAQLYGLYVPGGGVSPPWFPGADKVQHVLGFAVPVSLVLTARAAYAHLTARFLRATAAAFAAHAVISELIQRAFYRSRTGDPYDVLADTLGIGLGLLLVRALHASPLAEVGR